jgi:hypothetical protein
MFLRILVLVGILEIPLFLLTLSFVVMIVSCPFDSFLCYNIPMPEPIAIIGKYFPDVVIPLIGRASEEIRIVVYDWRIYPASPGQPISRFNSALSDAMGRGVKIRALVNSRALVPILRKFGVECKTISARGLVHAKMMIIDGRTVILGSHNYSLGAFSMNCEVSCAFDLESGDNGFVEYFERLWTSS